MSRGQMGKTFNTATEQNKAYNANANSSFSAAQSDLSQEQQGINSFGSEVDKFKADNPYVTGGAVQTAENQQLADTAAGIARSGGQAIQGAAVRTGQNAGGAIAGTEEMAREGTRALSGEEAGATGSRRDWVWGRSAQWGGNRGRNAKPACQPGSRYSRNGRPTRSRRSDHCAEGGRDAKLLRRPQCRGIEGRGSVCGRSRPGALSHDVRR